MYVSRAGDMDHNSPYGWMASVLVQVDALPDAQRQLAPFNGNAERYGRKRGPDVGGHVVRAFRGVPEDRVSVRHQARQKTFHIGLYGGIGIFLNEQRTARMLNEQMQHSGSDACLCQIF